MINIKEIYRLQAEHSVGDGGKHKGDITFEDYLDKCREFITKNLPPEATTGTMDPVDKAKIQEDLASQFVDLHRVTVQGFMMPNGAVDIYYLLQQIIDTITGASVLKEALEDEDVDEVQINDKNSIFIVKGGRNIPYVDKKGRPVRFASDEEINILLNRLIDDHTGTTPQFTDGLPILNAKTSKEQYRVAAVHSVANSRDKPPYDFAATSVVIRKFKHIKLTLDDLIKGGAMTPAMGRFVKLMGKANVKVFFVGKTGSGKTTLLNVVAQEIPLSDRIILVQNPTEITLFDRDEYGRNRRNAVHWEVKETDDEHSRSANMSNLLSHILRSTPDVAIIGESRSGPEFKQVARGLKMGERYMGTFHSEGSVQGISRFADEAEVTKGSLAKDIDIIIAQHKFTDGSRRLLEIAEIEGADANDNVIVNQMFKYVYDGDAIINEDGSRSLKGRFIHKNGMSPQLAEKFFLAGITKEELAEFLDYTEGAGDPGFVFSPTVNEKYLLSGLTLEDILEIKEVLSGVDVRARLSEATQKKVDTVKLDKEELKEIICFARATGLIEKDGSQF